MKPKIYEAHFNLATVLSLAIIATFLAVLGTKAYAAREHITHKFLKRKIDTMKHRLRGTMHDFLDHLALLTEHPRADPFHVLAEHDRTDLKDTQYWTDLKRIAEAHGLRWIDGVAVYTPGEKRKRIDILLTDGHKSVEGAIVQTESGITTFHGSERKSPHPDCGPPGWIRGEDKGHDVALITKPSIWQAAAKWFADLPVNVFGVAVPGATSVSLLRKYRKVLYLDDIDPCGVYRYLQWKKMVCAEWIGLTPNQLCGIPRNAAIPMDKEQFELIKKELIPPELEEVVRFLIAVGMVEIESSPADVMEDVIRAVRRSILAKL